MQPAGSRGSESDKPRALRYIPPMNEGSEVCTCHMSFLIVLKMSQRLHYFTTRQICTEDEQQNKNVFDSREKSEITMLHAVPTRNISVFLSLDPLRRANLILTRAFEPTGASSGW